MQAKPYGDVSYEIKKYIYIFIYLFKMFPFAATQSSAQDDSKICPPPSRPPQAKPLVYNPHSMTRRHTP